MLGTTIHAFGAASRERDAVLRLVRHDPWGYDVMNEGAHLLPLDVKSSEAGTRWENASRLSEIGAALARIG